MRQSPAFLLPGSAKLPWSPLGGQSPPPLTSRQKLPFISPPPSDRRSSRPKATLHSPPSFSPTPLPHALLIVDHGSRRPEANDMLSEIVDMLQTRLSIPVHMAHMELAMPSIADGIAACVNKGAKHIIILPFFLSPGRHTTADIPQLAAAATAHYSDITHEVRPPIGTHPAVIDILLDRAGLL